MKVFISWSGKRSKAIANALKDWVPLVLQNVELWVSDKDIASGERWAQAIAGELESSNFGILCVTPENLTSPWIMFEAGALSKSMLDSKVVPLLFNLELSDLTGPLSQFQANKLDQAGILSTIRSINMVSDKKTPEQTVEQLVPALWGNLESKIAALPDKDDAEKHLRPQAEILEELVAQVRGLGSKINDFQPDSSDREEKGRLYTFREIDTRVIEEILFSVREERLGLTALLVIAGIAREQMPWLSELLIDGHSRLRNAQSFEVFSWESQRLIKETISISRGPVGEMLLGRSKRNYVFARQIPRLVEEVVQSRMEILGIKQPQDAEKLTESE